MRAISLLVAITLSAITVSAQFKVKIEITKGEIAVRNTIKESLTKEFASFKDVTLTNDGKFKIQVQAMKRAVSRRTFDYFLTVVTTSDSICVVERDEGGRVTATTGCEELLSLDTYVGRSNELPEIIKEFVKSFNDFILEPRRDIEPEPVGSAKKR